MVDYQVLNQKTEVESVLLADLYSEFYWFGKAQFVTTLDLNHAYNKIPLVKASRPLTAFCTNWKLYRYMRVLFGLATGPQVLMTLLDPAFHDIQYHSTYHYLANPVVYTDFENHLVNMEQVFLSLKRCRTHSESRGNCIYCKTNRLLGHIASASICGEDEPRKYQSYSVIS